MTFNIRYGSADDGENKWELRKPLVIDRIKAFDPDLLGLQECQDDSQAKFIKDNLSQYEFLAVRRGGNGSTAIEMTPVLFKKTAFQIIRQGTFWLSRTPLVPGSKSWGSTFPRTVTWVELSHMASGKSLTFFNTHFDYEPSAIPESARLLRRWIEQYVGDRPLVVTGDFNAEKSSSAYQEMTSGSPILTDVVRVLHTENIMEGTFHGFGKEKNPYAIDWLLVSPQFNVISAAIDPYHAGNRYPSDHYPITASVEWRQGGS